MKTTKLVNGITPRKLIGTLALAFALAVGAFGTAKAAQAIFIGAGSTTIFDGVISSVGSNSVTVATNGNNSVTVGVTDKTVITGNKSLSDLSPGDPVKIVAKNDGNGHLIAKVINVSAASSYGTAGDVVAVKGTVTGKGTDTFTLNVNGVQVTFHVNSSTRFFGHNTSSLGDLMTGDKVRVFGQDTGSSSTGFVAQDVFGN